MCFQTQFGAFQIPFACSHLTRSTAALILPAAAALLGNGMVSVKQRQNTNPNKTHSVTFLFVYGKFVVRMYNINMDREIYLLHANRKTEHSNKNCLFSHLLRWQTAQAPLFHTVHQTCIQYKEITSWATYGRAGVTYFTLPVTFYTRAKMCHESHRLCGKARHKMYDAVLSKHMISSQGRSHTVLCLSYYLLYTRKTLNRSYLICLKR